MRNFFSLAIHRLDMDETEVFIFHNDGNFVDKKIERKTPDYKEEKVKIYGKNKLIDIFSYNTGFYSNSEVSIIRFLDGKWGILHRNGKIYENNMLVEPIVEKDTHEIIGFSNGKLAPFYTKEGDMAFVNKFCEIITIGKIDRNLEKIHLWDKNQKILSEWNFSEVFVPEEFFFLGGNFCNITEKYDFNKLFKQFESEDYGYYIFPSEIYGPKILKENKMKINSGENIVNYGKLYLLGYVYYTKFECNNYCFLKQYMKELFQKEYDNFKRKLDKILGSPLISEERYNVWKQCDEFLVLDFFCDYGEGDFGYQIRMYIQKDPQLSN